MRDVPMDEQGSGEDPARDLLPVANATTPYWRTQLHWIDSYRSSEQLPTEQVFDVAIIGAGMSGVATAYHLLKAAGDKPPSIIILDAREVCSGATGRNGGHCKIQTTSTQGMIQRHGLAIAEEVTAFVRKHIYALKEVVETESLDCEFELRRSFDVFLDEAEARVAKENFLTSLKAGQTWTREVGLVDERFAEQVTSIKGVRGAYSVPICSFWPYKFVSQLLANLVEKQGVQVQTNTPVTKVTHEHGRNILHTARGSLQAHKVVFATNAYTAGLCPDQYAGIIVPVRGTACHISPSPFPFPSPSSSSSSPTPTTAISPHLSHTYNINYTPGPQRTDYLNPRPDGSIVVGGAKWKFETDRAQWYDNWDDSTQQPGTSEHFAGLMQRHFRGWESSGAEVDSIWTGVMGNTPDGVPHVGAVPGREGLGQYVIAGFNGGGNALIFLSAEGLAGVMGGVEFGDTGVPGLFRSSWERLGRDTGAGALGDSK